MKYVLKEIERSAKQRRNEKIDTCDICLAIVFFKILFYFFGYSSYLVYKLVYMFVSIEMNFSLLNFLHRIIRKHTFPIVSVSQLKYTVDISEHVDDTRYCIWAFTLLCTLRSRKVDRIMCVKRSLIICTAVAVTITFFFIRNIWNSAIISLQLRKIYATIKTQQNLFGKWKKWFKNFKVVNVYWSTWDIYLFEILSNKVCLPHNGIWIHICFVLLSQVQLDHLFLWLSHKCNKCSR